MTTTDSTAIPTRMSQCLAAPPPISGFRVRSSRNRGVEVRLAGTAKAAGVDRSATDCHSLREVTATLVEQKVIAVLRVIVLHTVGRLLARIPDTSDGIW